MFSHSHHPQDAMKFATRFLDRFAEIIVTVLSCFDRVIFKGYLPVGNNAHLNSCVDYGLKMKRRAIA